MGEAARKAADGGADTARHRAERCPACGGELESAGSIGGRRGVLYLIARCLRCQTAFWRAPAPGRTWE